MSNQQPMSSNEYSHSKDSTKTTLSFDDEGVCHACRFNMLKETGEIDWDERERELLGEQSRWFDLARWGNLIERVKLHNPQGAPFIKAHHILRPIPQLQIDRAEGTSSGFPQNPGY
jgi:hypothetical protein